MQLNSSDPADATAHEALPALERIATALEMIASTLKLHLALPTQCQAPNTPPAATLISAPRSEVATSALAAPAPRLVAADTAVQDSRVIAFLAERGITVENTLPESPAAAVFDRLALFLGKNYRVLRPLLSEIKRNMQAGHYFQFPLRDTPPQAIGVLCQFCTELERLALLEQYHYRRSPQRVISARPSSTPQAQSFFSGQWLERYVHQQLLAFAQELLPETRFEILKNAQIRLANGDSFELDFVLAIDETIFWIEAKSGKYQEHIARYSRFARQLALSPRHALMVLAEATEANCADLSRLFDMTVVTPDMLVPALFDVLLAAFEAQARLASEEADQRAASGAL